jgi:signal recognition particle subunit SRP54
MFASLTDNLTKIFEKLTGRGVLSEDDINAAMREIRVALLEADVSLSVVKEFIAELKEKALGVAIVKTIAPGQMVVKIVHDHLISLLGSEQTPINLVTTPPAVIMMVGLQGSGKTTSSAKLALRLTQKHHKKVCVVSLDVARPAAQEQLAILAKQVNIASLAIVAGESPLVIAKRAMESARRESFDVVIFDTAGRLHVDDALMNELEQIKLLTKPIEILLVADAMTGQDAVTIATKFHQLLSLTGIILTRIDGDSRGGSALSMRMATSCPIKYLGVGEKLSEFEEFHPQRIASRILGMSDIVSLVEKAVEHVDQHQAQLMAEKLSKGQFDLDDLGSQIKNIRKMGGVGSMMSFLPGLGKLKNKLAGGQFDEKLLLRQEAIISSMTKQERKNSKILNASRKIRVAKGAGVSVHEVNKLLKNYLDMSTMLKKFGKMDKKSLARSGISRLFS